MEVDALGAGGVANPDAEAAAWAQVALCSEHREAESPRELEARGGPTAELEAGAAGGPGGVSSGEVAQRALGDGHLAGDAILAGKSPEVAVAVGDAAGKAAVAAAATESLAALQAGEGAEAPGLNTAAASPPDEREKELYEASRKGEAVEAQRLLDAGANFSWRHPQCGATALHAACTFGHIDTARLLIRAGAPVDAAADDGTTPLYTACKSGGMEASVKLLLEAGADPSRRAQDGLTPLDISRQRNQVRVVHMLLDRAFRDVPVPVPGEALLSYPSPSGSEPYLEPNDPPRPATPPQDGLAAEEPRATGAEETAEAVAEGAGVAAATAAGETIRLPVQHEDRSVVLVQSMASPIRNGIERLLVTEFCPPGKTYSQYNRRLIKFMLSGKLGPTGMNNYIMSQSTMNESCAIMKCNSFLAAYTLRGDEVIAAALLMLVNAKSGRRCSDKDQVKTLEIIFFATASAWRRQQVARRLLWDIMEHAKKEPARVAVLSDTPFDYMCSTKKDCGGNSICEHGQERSTCMKLCNWWREKGGFAKDKATVITSERDAKKHLGLGDSPPGCTFYSPWSLYDEDSTRGGFGVSILLLTINQVTCLVRRERPADPVPTPVFAPGSEALGGAGSSSGGDGGPYGSTGVGSRGGGGSSSDGGGDCLSGRSRSLTGFPLKNTAQPAMIEFFAGEASVAHAFHTLGWTTTVIEADLSKIKFDGHFRRDDPRVTVWAALFQDLDWNQLLTQPCDFSFFGNPCHTFCHLAAHVHGRTERNPRGTSQEAWLANRLLQRTCDFINARTTQAAKEGRSFTFAIENPDAWLKRQDAVRKLCQRHKAVVIKFSQCHYGTRWQKHQNLVTNEKALIYHFGTWDKECYPDAPDPKFICCVANPCLHFNRHEQISRDVEASETAPYPPSLVHVMSQEVHSRWCRDSIRLQ